MQFTRQLARRDKCHIGSTILEIGKIISLNE